MTRIILVVDDEPVLASLLVMLLEEEGFDVRSAGNGEAALAAHRTDPADLILSDIMMPRLSGLAMIEALRTSGDPTPVILMSAVDNPRGRPRDVLFLRKPFDIDDVLTTVQHALRERPPGSLSPRNLRA